jgi:hypothetical protein
MEITDDIEQKIIDDNITRITKRLDELQPSFIKDESKEVDSLSEELKHWLLLQRRWNDEHG